MQNSTLPELSALQLQNIDEICNAFELAFKAGKSPRAEEFLAAASEPLRMALVPELIQLEKHYRSDFSTAELSFRFPQLDQTWLDGLIGSTEQIEHPAIPGYFIIEEIGRGGMGIVYLAADLTLHRQVALKMIHRSSQFSDVHRRRFVGEARAAARLHHPNLVQIFDAGEFEGHPFLVFELVNGGTLAEKIRGQPLNVRESAKLIETLSLALQYAHDRHIIHRDIKPSNILMGNDGVARISDFGLAKRLDEDVQQTVSGMVVGTPSYMAPEQAAGLSGASSPAVDVYSLGAVFYELLTGQPPFKAASVMETLEQLRNTDPIPPRRIRNDIPRDLETICLKCLQKEPFRRYMSAQLLAEEIGRFLQGEPIISRPVGLGERVGRWCRRHPLPTALATALIIVFVAAFTTVSWQWKEAVAQKKLAETNAEKFQAERDKAIHATALAKVNAAATEYQRSIAERHLAAAESRFEKAQAPIQELIRLGIELVRQPHMEARGRQALEKASQFRQSLLEEKTDDPEARYVTAATFHVLAWTLLEHGEFSAAEQTYNETLSLLKDLNDQDPNNRRFLRLMRSVCLERGVALSHLYQPEAAEQSCHDSVLYAERLVAIDTKNAGDQVGLGSSLSNWSGRLLAIGRQEEAVATLQRSVDLQRAVASVHPDIDGYQTDLALALSSLASQLWKADPKAAEALAVEALEIRRTLVSRAVAPRDAAMYLVSSLNQLTNRYNSLERLSEAEELSAEAIQLAQSARNSFPAFHGIRIGYINTLVEARRLAAKRKDTERTNELVSELHQELAAAVIDFPNDEYLKEQDAWFRHRWGVLLAERGETDEAMKTLMSSLHDLRSVQSQSSNPARLRRNMLYIARAALTVGKRFEFEQEKLQAVAEWVAQEPENSSAHNALAWHQVCARDESLRDAVAAEQSVRRAIELKADQPSYHNTLGVALYYQDRLDEAVAEFERSLDLMNNLQPMFDWCFLAMIESRRGNIDKAMTFLEKALAWHREHRSDDDEVKWILDEVARVPGLLSTGDD